MIPTRRIGPLSLSRLATSLTLTIPVILPRPVLSLVRLLLSRK